MKIRWCLRATSAKRSNRSIQPCGRSRRQRDPANRRSEHSPVHVADQPGEVRSLRNGVKVTYRDRNGGMETRILRVFDFDDPERNHFLAVRELWIKGRSTRRRGDLVGFVNGIPLLFMELKNIHRNVRRAYDENLADYQDTIPTSSITTRSWSSATAWTPAWAATLRPSSTSASGSASTRTSPASWTWRRCSRACAPRRTSWTCSRTSSSSTIAAKGSSRWSPRTSSTSA